ncbi:MAG: phosphatidylethanolamine N-methyltransferase / phosphatidyl-N-methylethanolamine N-methyltransferase [Rhodoferax sp.]|nr:phosphatidylethanolamine N-methyltransferase / phosphatidyl-N-methylethanolamine N-methyltransferase [Rhodoferax sp.]
MTTRPGESVRAAAETADDAPGKPGADTASVVRAYGRMAPVYDFMFGRVLEPGRQRMCQAVRALNLASILEVGVGTGLALGGYPPSARVVGVDVSEQMLARARQRAALWPERDIAMHRIDAEHMPFADHSFDCVTLPYVLSVTPRPARLVQEVRRVCQPGGHILLLNHFSGSRFWWSLERLVKPAAEQVGFRSDFKFADHVLAWDWQVLDVQPVNLFGLSKLVHLRN